MPALLSAISRPLLRHLMPVDADERPPQSTEAMVAYMARWGLLGARRGLDSRTARNLLPELPVEVETAPTDIRPLPPAPEQPVRLPAQWEPVESVILAWPVLYPPLWAQHAEMIEAIIPAAEVVIVVPSPLWARAVWFFLAQRGPANAITRAHLARLDNPAAAGMGPRVRFLYLPTDDIWVRDYGPLVGQAADGTRVCVKPVFNPLPNYPQARDNTMALRWAAWRGLPVRRLNLRLEGGNLWSDGAGTLITSEQVFAGNPGLTPDALEAALRPILDYQKLIITPRLRWEETGHVDLMVKLADAQTALVSASAPFYDGGRLRAAADVLRAETNTAGQPYRVIELPAPPPYLNWGVYPIWRSYANALTVNGRVLVPVFGIASDQRALDIYCEAMPGYNIIPVNCRVGINGGGAVHCLTRDIPA